MSTLKQNIQGLLKNNQVDKAYALMRYMYRVGHPIVDDEFYDKIHNYCVKYNIAEEYTSRTYDDDPIPYDLLREFGLEKYVPTMTESRSEYLRYLDEEKSLSIQAVTNYSDAYNYFMGVREYDLVASMKGDGVFTKSLVLDDDLKICLSRGRSGNSIDYTANMIKVVPTKFSTGLHEVKLYGEAFVLPEALDYVAKKYDPTAYKTEKSSAISMLRVAHHISDYKYLKVMMFGAEGLDTTISGTLEKLKSMGLEVVPHVKIEANTIPVGFEEFQVWLKNLLDTIWQMREGLPSDGVVVDVDDMLFSAEIKNQYSSRNIALKMEQWSPSFYEAKVTGVLIEQRRVEASVRLTIEPVKAKDRTEAKYVNGYSPAIIINNGIKPGSTLTFERNSGAINVLLYGDNLRKKKLGL